MDPMTAMALAQMGIQGGKAAQQHIEKKLKSHDINAPGDKDFEIQGPVKPVDLTSNKQTFNPYGSRRMTSGTSSIEPAVDSNYDQRFNDLAMGPINNTSVPENDEINRGDIFSNEIS